MQQTKKYELNLIETSDPFLPEALNQNTQKVEKALDGLRTDLDAGTSAETAAREAADTALSDRVTALEAKKVVAGVYYGNAVYNDTTKTQFIDLGFTPFAVFAYRGPEYTALALTGRGGTGVAVVENGFSVSNVGTIRMNELGYSCNYLAFG